MLFLLPLPCPGLINTRRLIFGSGVRAGLELSPGALLNVINYERAVRRVCEWHLSPRPSSNIYTVEVQPVSLLEKSFRFASYDVHLNHCFWAPMEKTLGAKCREEAVEEAGFVLGEDSWTPIQGLLFCPMPSFS